MKSFKSIREGNSVEPGVSEIDDVQDDPLSFVEIKPKKTKVVKEDLQEAVSVKKEKHSWGTMMTAHHGSDTSYPLHPEHQSAIKKLRPGMKTTFKDETNSTVHAHREGDTVHLTRPKTGSTLTSLPYHHFDTSEHAKPAAKKPAGEYDRKVTDHLKKKYNEEAIIEAHTEDDIANGGTVIYKHGGKHYMAKVSHKTGGGAGTMIHTTSSLGHKIKLNQVVSTDASDWTKYKNIKEETEQISEAPKSFAKLVQKLQTTKRHMVAKSRAKKLVTASKSASAAGDKMTADAAMSKSKRYSNIAKGMDEQMEKEVMQETKGAPKGFHFTKDGKLKRGDADRDGSGGPMLRTDPLDKQRSKVPPVSEMHSAKDIKMAVGVAKDKRYAGGNMTGAVKAMEKMKPGLSKHPRVQQVLKSTNEGIDFLKIWDGIKPVHEEVKTTHEDPLVLTKDTEGHIHTHANLSVANAIHGTDVKHQAIHTGKPVQAGKFTFELSKHHEGALKEDAPFDPVAHKKELDRLMTKHIMAHKALMASPGRELQNKQMERLNSIKAEIRAHKDKVPAGPAPKPGSAAHYYASKKPGEYTGD